VSEWILTLQKWGPYILWPVQLTRMVTQAHQKHGFYAFATRMLR